MNIKNNDYLEGLWIDKEDALSKVSTLCPKNLRSKVKKFIQDGYVVFERAVNEDIIDQIISDTEEARNNPTAFVLRNAGKYIDPSELSALGVGDRVIDIYGASKAARSAIHAPIISQFLETIFQRPAIAMQSLSFTYGSQQAIHQDTAYVISKKPLHLAASWLALEDVKEGVGELVYYPSSHRFKHFLFDEETKGWTKKIHGVGQHQKFLYQLHEQAKERGLKKASFLAKKGDILIWHADLAHGGNKITTETTTRRSLVTHYCPENIKPKYYDIVADNYYEYSFNHSNDSKALFASRHYKLKDLIENDTATIYFDGGVSNKRNNLYK